ncbi:hypothetical protein [Intestinibacter bartlettii]|nr:hypothetical protein [Intestinibacter bartlettii]
MIVYVVDTSNRRCKLMKKIAIEITGRIAYLSIGALATMIIMM